MSANPPKQKLFLSHNNRDKDHVRPLAAALQIAGGQVWFDEWTLRPGDSVPGGISEGLASFDVFVLVWSQNAAQSRWVAAELNSALVQQIEGSSRRIVPVLLDPTPLPALIGHLLYLDAPSMGHLEVARNLLGIDSQRLFRKAIQSFIFEADLNFREYWGVGVLVACPQCGATLDRIRGFESIDDARDEVCRGAECLDCGWSDGSDV
jgi:hypothetical protein